MQLKRSLALREGEVVGASHRLAAFPWLPASIRESLAKEPSGDLAGSSLMRLRTAVDSVRESLYAVRDRFDWLVEAGRVLSADVGARDRSRTDTPLLRELSAEMGDRLRAEFDQEEIRNALFDGGELTYIDLGRLEAKWRVDGEERSRPFEAFSSGEQVFAYTRARIERAKEIEATHKIIALDEFGAFLARDRLERLARYLRDSVVGAIADQVLIVIPMAANYETQAAESRGPLQKRFQSRAEQIEQRGYFVDDATKRELV